MSQSSANPYPSGPPTGGTSGPSDGTPSGPWPGPQPFSPPAERNWAMAAHLSSFVAAYVALGFLGPLVVMLLAGDRSPYVRRHAVEALNFNLTWLIYIAVSALLAIVLIGIPILIILAVAYLVLVVMAAMEASRGGEFRYPFTIRFVS
ncbi:MAG: DUF4870 domain-containing protein [Actinomycetes bacterium]